MFKRPPLSVTSRACHFCPRSSVLVILLSTLCTALDLKHATGLPVLTSKLVCTYPPQSLATAMGHMDQSRKSQRLTNPRQVHHQPTKRPPAPCSRNHHCPANAPITSTLRSPTPIKQGRSFQTKRAASSFPQAPAAPNSSLCMTTTPIISLPSQ